MVLHRGGVAEGSALRASSELRVSKVGQRVLEF